MVVQRRGGRHLKSMFTEPNGGEGHSRAAVVLDGLQWGVSDGDGGFGLQLDLVVLHVLYIASDASACYFVCICMCAYTSYYLFVQC